MSDEKKYHVRINRSERETILKPRERGVQYSSQKDTRVHEIQGFEVVEPNSYTEDFILPYDPAGQTMYLVYALYDDGDSYNSHENLIHHIALVRNIEDAKTILAAVTQDFKDYQDDKQDPYKHVPLKIHLPIEDRTVEVYTGTWKGYFAHLRELKVESLGGGLSVRF